MDMEWKRINNMRVKLQNGTWKSYDDDLYEFSVLVLEEHRRVCREKIYNILETVIGVNDIVYIIQSYEQPILIGTDTYDTPEESKFHEMVIAQLNSWNSTNNPAYSALFINDLKHMTDHRSHIHTLSHTYDIENITGYIMRVDSFFEPVDCLYFRTEYMEVGRIIGMGRIINDRQSILLIVKCRRSYAEYYDKIYKVDIEALRNNMRLMKDRNDVYSCDSWDGIYAILQNIGVFYAHLTD